MRVHEVTTTDVTLEANPAFRCEVLTVGRERTPVLVIDDFAIDTGPAIRYASDAAGFGVEATSAYPGIRSPLPRRQVLGTLDGVYELLYRVYSIPHRLRLRPQNAVFSLISRPPAELTLSQSVPHYDSSRPWYFALTHFLNPGEFGGTGLFRHRPTGFENIREERVAEYVRAGEAFVAAHGAPRPGYIRDSNAHYEMFEQITWRANRLVAYPGSLLHSGLVDPARDVSSDPATGRLTANIFVDFQ